MQEGIAVYKSIRDDIKRAVPFLPLGFIPLREQNAWHAFGIRIEGLNRAYLVVWRLASPDMTTTVPLDFLEGKDTQVELLFPRELPVEYRWHKAAGRLAVKQPTPYSARVFRIEWSEYHANS